MKDTKHKFRYPSKNGYSSVGESPHECNRRCIDPLDWESHKQSLYLDFCTRLRRDMSGLTPNELAAVIDAASYHFRLKVGGMI